MAAGREVWGGLAARIDWMPRFDQILILGPFALIGMTRFNHDISRGYF